MEQELNEIQETQETTEKESILKKISNFIRNHRGTLGTVAGVGAGFLLACLCGGSDKDEESFDEGGDVEEVDESDEE